VKNPRAQLKANWIDGFEKWKCLQKWVVIRHSDLPGKYFPLFPAASKTSPSSPHVKLTKYQSIGRYASAILASVSEFGGTLVCVVCCCENSLESLRCVDPSVLYLYFLSPTSPLCTSLKSGCFNEFASRPIDYWFS
jgi:hypothetical protein